MKHLTEKSSSLKLFQKLNEGTKYKRISRFNEFDNGHIFHSWNEWTDEEAEEQAKQASIKDPTDVYYVQYDDVMNPNSGIYWYKGNSYSYEEVNNLRKKDKEANWEKIKTELLSKIFARYPDISKEDEEYLNSLDLQSLKDEIKNRGWEDTLKEDSLNPGIIQLYMNTWGNYNEHGADVESINGGWMDIDQAKEFLEAHKDEEPFINDTENVPGDLDIDEYTNPWQAIEELEYIENSDNKDALIAIIESVGDFENAKEIYESGDYTFFSGVEDDEGLGRAYVDMVGGLEGVANAGNYIDEEAYKESWREAAEQDVRENNPDLDENSDEFEDEVENWLNGVAMEELENEKAAGNDLSEYFDYEAFGRDLDFEGYFFASTGAIQTN